MSNSSYETVAASQTDQALGPAGKAGDYLDRLIIKVNTAATGTVEIQDGGEAAIPIMPASPGGGVGVYVVELKIHSRAGAWQVTTGAGATVLAIGNFS